MLTSHELFGFMSPELANDILNFVRESDKPTYKSALNAVAQARHVRPVFLERHAAPQRQATMIVDSCPNPRWKKWRADSSASGL